MGAYLAVSSGAGPVARVVVVHEALGLNYDLHAVWSGSPAKGSWRPRLTRIHVGGA